MGKKCKNKGKAFASVTQTVPQRKSLAVELVAHKTFARYWISVAPGTHIMDGGELWFADIQAPRGVARYRHNDETDVFTPLPYLATSNPKHELNHRGEMVQRFEGNPTMSDD